MNFDRALTICTHNKGALRKLRSIARRVQPVEACLWAAVN